MFMLAAVFLTTCQIVFSEMPCPHGLPARQTHRKSGPLSIPAAATIGGQVSDALIAKVKPGATNASVVGPPPGAKLHPAVKVEAFSSHPDAASICELAEDIANGKFKIPVDRVFPLADAARAHAEAEKGGIGKVPLSAFGQKAAALQSLGKQAQTIAVPHKSFTISPLRPRKTNTCPEKGCCCNTVCTWPLSPSKPRRMSVTPAAIQIFVPVGSCITCADSQESFE